VLSGNPQLRGCDGQAVPVELDLRRRADRPASTRHRLRGAGAALGLRGGPAARMAPRDGVEARRSCDGSGPLGSARARDSVQPAETQGGAAHPFVSGHAGRCPAEAPSDVAGVRKTQYRYARKLKVMETQVARAKAAVFVARASVRMPGSACARPRSRSRA